MGISQEFIVDIVITMDHISLRCRFLELKLVKFTQIKINLCIVLGSEPRRKTRRGRSGRRGRREGNKGMSKKDNVNQYWI